MKKYIIYYFKPEPQNYAYHITHCWLLAKIFLWILKKEGYYDAYMEQYDSLKVESIKIYGYEFGEVYDKIQHGIPIGNLENTIDFLNKLENVKNGLA